MIKSMRTSKVKKIIKKYLLIIKFLLKKPARMIQHNLH